MVFKNKKIYIIHLCLSKSLRMQYFSQSYLGLCFLFYLLITLKYKRINKKRLKPKEEFFFVKYMGCFCSIFILKLYLWILCKCIYCVCVFTLCNVYESLCWINIYPKQKWIIINSVIWKCLMISYLTARESR